MVVAAGGTGALGAPRVPAGAMDLDLREGGRGVTG